MPSFFAFIGQNFQLGVLHIKESPNSPRSYVDALSAVQHLLQQNLKSSQAHHMKFLDHHCTGTQSIEVGDQV